jgi:hypothetical protein
MIKANVTAVPQPNARVSTAEHLESFRTYYRVVHDPNIR